MPLTDPVLWETIQQWPLPHHREEDKSADPPRICDHFEHNLRMRGDWSDLSASRITEMYRRFLYLKALSGEPIAPSEVIDMAWHLHLEFPRNYAALCATLGREIPHLTDLPRKERVRAYERGRALYEAEFDRPVDVDMWPSEWDQQLAKVVPWVMIAAFAAVWISALIADSIGGLAGLLLFGGAIAALAWVGFHLVRRVVEATPSQMARCA
jgi:hypothetical protein